MFHHPKVRRFATIPLLCLVLAGAGCSGDQPAIHRQRILAFGTLIDISLWGVDEQTARDAGRVLGEDFNLMHDTWHAWRPSTLTRINTQLESGAWFTPDQAMLPLIELAGRLSRDSETLFNPAIGRLIRLWGFQQDEPPARPPDPRAVQTLRDADPRMTDIRVDGGRIRSRNPHARIDFGGFAKGYGVDLAIERLRELGIHNAVVNAGGDLRAIGQPGTRPWRVGVRHPRREGVLASLEISGDESVFSSGDYERYFIHQGRRYHHILDPRTGFPADGAQSVTVIGTRAADADAAATALFVAGMGDWPRIARSLKFDKVMLVAPDGSVEMTPGMAARLHFQVQPLPVIRILEPGTD